jgi:hypothetical protein
LGLGFGFGLGAGFGFGASLGLAALGAEATRFTEIAAGGSLEELRVGPQYKKMQITTKCPAREYNRER